MVEIAAHSRIINAIDLHPTTMLVSITQECASNPEKHMIGTVVDGIGGNGGSCPSSIRRQRRLKALHIRARRTTLGRGSCGHLISELRGIVMQWYLPFLWETCRKMERPLKHFACFYRRSLGISSSKGHDALTVSLPFCFLRYRSRGEVR